MRRLQAGPRLTVYYDGTCGMCSRGVSWIQRNDTHGRLVFVPLQTEDGRRAATRAGLDPDVLSTMIVRDGDRLFTKSDATLRAARELSGIWPGLAALAIVPRPLRDFVYDIVARNRYLFLGRVDTCVVKPAEPDDSI